MSIAELRPAPPLGPAAAPHRLTRLQRRAPVRRGLWWISPAGALLLVVPGGLWVAADLDDAEYRLQWNTPKSLTGHGVLLVVAAVLVFVLGSLLAQAAARRRRRPASQLSPSQLVTLERASTVLFRLTVLGYLAFAAAGAARGASLRSVLTAVVDQQNYSSSFSAQFAPVTGVTTLTQFGMAYVVVAALLHLNGVQRRVPRRVIVVLLLALVRAFLNTERLALIELLVPLLAVSALAYKRRAALAPRAVVTVLPAALVPLVFVVFGIFEYSRSWQFFKDRTDQSFAHFVVTRVAGYYATAFNNGQLRLDYARYPGRLPYESVQLLWDAPVVSQLHLYDRLSAAAPTSASGILAAHGNPEFNNPGGITVPFVDFGPVGGFVFFLVAGVIVGLLYRGFVDGQPLGMLVYPIALTGTFELPRYIYWTEGRVLPSLIFLAVLVELLRRAGIRDAVRAAGGDRAAAVRAGGGGRAALPVTAPPRESRGSTDGAGPVALAADGHPRAGGRPGGGHRPLHDRAGGGPARPG